MTSRHMVARLFLVVLIGAAGLAPQIVAAGEPQLKKVEFPGGFCDLYLLAQEMVQNDLSLSADQVTKIRELVANLIEKKRALTFEKHVQQLKRDQQIALGLLTPEQVRRLRQISLQCAATASFWDSSLRQTLQISEYQWQKIEGIPYPKEVGAETEEIALIRKDFFDYPKRADKKWQNREWKRIAELTPTQQVKWKKMLGKPFNGAFPSAVLVPRTVTLRPGTIREPSIKALRLEIRTLRERLIQIEKHLVEIEKSKQK